MRWGAIVRAEDRGLGVLTREVVRNLHPDRVLAIDMGEWARGFAPHHDWYPDARWAEFDGRTDRPLDLNAVLAWAEGLDVVWTAETAYDWRIPVHLRTRGIQSVLHTMPEFHRPQCDLVDHVWLPTPWLKNLHPNRLIVPIPIALDRYGLEHLAAEAHTHGPLRVLHTAGHRAAMDRNGTLILLDAMRLLRQQVHVTIRTQDPDIGAPEWLPPNVTCEIVTRSGGEWWEQYGGHHALVMPRRYGGLCLPVQEAMGAGLAVLMSDCPPNDWWPTMRVGGGRGSAFQAPAGEIRAFNTDPSLLARAIDAWAADRDELAAFQEASSDWAVQHSWEALGPDWLRRFGKLVP